MDWHWSSWQASFHRGLYHEQTGLRNSQSLQRATEQASSCVLHKVAVLLCYPEDFWGNASSRLISVLPTRHGLTSAFFTGTASRDVHGLLRRRKPTTTSLDFLRCLSLRQRLQSWLASFQKGSARNFVTMALYPRGAHAGSETCPRLFGKRTGFPHCSLVLTRVRFGGSYPFTWAMRTEGQTTLYDA